MFLGTVFFMLFYIQNCLFYLSFINSIMFAVVQNKPKNTSRNLLRFFFFSNFYHSQHLVFCIPIVSLFRKLFRFIEISNNPAILATVLLSRRRLRSSTIHTLFQCSKQRIFVLAFSRYHTNISWRTEHN